LHDSTETRRWTGQAQVQRGEGVVARLIGWIIGFPDASPEVPVNVVLAYKPHGELWTRDFAGKTFSSFQQRGTGKDEHLLVERFGPINVALALVVDNDRLFLIPRRWSCLGIPLPGFLLPQGQSFETEQDGKFCFDVEIAAPLVGLIVAYKGILLPS
ncbi:MAG: DUF4166 domain-containing protein, partial [Hyphomicrobiaceae bacterium]